MNNMPIGLRQNTLGLIYLYVIIISNYTSFYDSYICSRLGLCEDVSYCTYLGKNAFITLYSLV